MEKHQHPICLEVTLVAIFANFEFQTNISGKKGHDYVTTK